MRKKYEENKNLIILVTIVHVIDNFYYDSRIEASHGAVAQECDCKCDNLWVRFSLEGIKYLKFLFLCSGIEANAWH